MDEVKRAPKRGLTWIAFWIALGAVALVALIVLFTLELLPPPAFLRGAFLALRQAMTNFELGLINLFSN